MKNKEYKIALVLTIVILIAIAIYSNYHPKNQFTSGSTNAVYQPIVYEPATQEDFQRFIDLIPRNEIIQKLPKDARLLLRFYNSDSGERVWQRDYIITKGNIKEGFDENVDISMAMHSQYLSKFDGNNFCFIIQDSKRRGDFGSNLLISKVSALWKYKSIMSYKSCLGL
ncbi:MAG TPA: hypothetical protein VJ438_06090 [Candidatus Nanoarchaeia archaeon]|nr:hypothetical protein [Candidatus Nanoarchaeia archaeon]